MFGWKQLSAQYLLAVKRHNVGTDVAMVVFNFRSDKVIIRSRNEIRFSLDLYVSVILGARLLNFPINFFSYSFACVQMKKISLMYLSHNNDCNSCF